MMAVHYSHWGMRQLEHLAAQSRHSEEDFKRRLEARHLRDDRPDSHQAALPDPVAKRLGFLLAKARDERRAVERELAVRRRCSGRVCATSTSFSARQVASRRSGPSSITTI